MLDGLVAAGVEGAATSGAAFAAWAGSATFLVGVALVAWIVRDLRKAGAPAKKG